MTMPEFKKKGSTADWIPGEQPQQCPVCKAPYLQGCGLGHVGGGAPVSSKGLRIEFTCGCQVNFIHFRRGIAWRPGAVHSCWKIYTHCDAALLQAVGAIGEMIGPEGLAEMAGLSHVEG